MRRQSRMPLVCIACMAAASLAACATIDLDPGGPDKSLVRYGQIVDAQAAYDQAEPACASTDPAACRRRDALLAELRKRGYCRQTSEPAAARAEDRYALWVSCRRGF